MKGCFVFLGVLHSTCVTNLHDFVLRWREENNRNDGSKILEDMVDYMQVAFQVIKIMVMVMMMRSRS